MSVNSINQTSTKQLQGNLLRTDAVHSSTSGESSYIILNSSGINSAIDSINISSTAVLQTIANNQIQFHRSLSPILNSAQAKGNVDSIISYLQTHSAQVLDSIKVQSAGVVLNLISDSV